MKNQTMKKQTMTILLRASAFALAAMFASGMPASPLQAAETPAPTNLPGDSVYQLDVSLLDQDGRAMHFADGRGKPRLVTMFYSSCQFMCPLIIDTLRQTEHALPPAARQQLDVLMVSFDAEKDTPAVLKGVAEKRHLDTPRWMLARASSSDVRRIAAVLGIQYRKMRDGEFSHSSVLVLLDADGRIVARTEKMGVQDPQFVASTAALLTPY
ncbi:MAG: SCO family protein [Dokdonella sp.]